MVDRGGVFGKLGIRYEDRWTVRCVLAMLQDEAEAIRLEPPGPEGEGVEFWLRYPDRVEYHQVKRQRTGEGRWSLSALRSVLTTFLEKLQDPNARCVFVSGHSAYVLESLAMRARTAVTHAEFEAELAENQTWRAHYDELRTLWGGLAIEVAFDALQRIAYGRSARPSSPPGTR